MFSSIQANLPEGLGSELFALEFDDEKYEEKLAALVADVPVDSVTNLNDGIPTQEEMDKIIGKTGQELIDEGWSNHGYNLETMEFYCDHDVYSFIIVFDGQVEAGEDEDAFEKVRTHKVKSVSFERIGDPVNITYDE